MKWRRREDDARRTKGDPPPTVDQLLVQTKQQGDIIRNLRSQVDGLNKENARLRATELGLDTAESKPGGQDLDPDPSRGVARLKEPAFPGGDVAGADPAGELPVARVGEGSGSVLMTTALTTQPGCPDNPDLCQDAECVNPVHLPDPDTIWGTAAEDASWVEFDYRAKRREDR